MEKVSRGSTLKIALCLAVAAIIQTILPQLAPVWLGQWLKYIDWLLLVVVYVGLQRDPTQALVTGTVAGVFQDILSLGRGAGVSGLAYLLAAYGADRIAAWIVVDNLLVRFSAVVAGNLVSTMIRLLFYRVLGIEFPTMAGGKSTAATITFGLFANLIVSTLLYIALDRVFKRDASVRVRRMEARRLRPKL